MALSLFLVGAGLIGCDSSGPEYDPEVEPGVFSFDFSTGDQGWESIFVAYYVGEEEFFELESDHRALPEPFSDQQGLFIAGHNRSDALRMFFKRRVEGLEPDATYSVQFKVEIASSVGTGCFGAGGSPGESVHVTAAATAMEPERVPPSGSSLSYQWNEAVFEALQETFSPGEPPTMGTINNELSCEEASDLGNSFRLKQIESGSDFWTVTASEDGSAWLVVGTWSGYEGYTRLYYNQITARFVKQSD